MQQKEAFAGVVAGVVTGETSEALATDFRPEEAQLKGLRAEPPLKKMRLKRKILDGWRSELLR